MVCPNQYLQVLGKILLKHSNLSERAQNTLFMDRMALFTVVSDYVSAGTIG